MTLYRGFLESQLKDIVSGVVSPRAGNHGRRTYEASTRLFLRHILEGNNDEELLNWARAHAEREHPDMELIGGYVRQMVADGAHEAQGKAYENK
jgi:hypothetical protein